MKPKVILTPQEHRGQHIVALSFPKDDKLMGIAKGINAKWSVTKKVWWIPRKGNVVNQIFEAFKNDAFVDYSAFKQKTTKISDQKAEPKPKVNLSKVAWTKEQKDAMWAYAEKLRIRKYSQSTYNTYGVYFKKFLAAHPSADPKEITEEQIKKHIVATVKKHNYATKTQN